MAYIIAVSIDESRNINSFNKKIKNYEKTTYRPYSIFTYMCSK